ncbi:hypothetical protein A6X21_07050 [Planctopirus hydrillae]|uniref:Uncharacterized protein n=1 Tax=Planctopirus hydrillae TaxID=1841610 RepID=A0A1C3EA14_9PLAN|nr:hypothetical protein A6X21_07050 [Planctopirus hydrillae]
MSHDIFPDVQVFRWVHVFAVCQGFAMCSEVPDFRVFRSFQRVFSPGSNKSGERFNCRPVQKSSPELAKSLLWQNAF